MSIRCSSRYCSLLALMAVAVLGTGCVTNGRRILLKEYGPSVPALADQPLRGATICLKAFTSVPNLTSFELKTKPEEPKPFNYSNLTHAQDQLWDKEMKDLQKKTTQADWREIGNMRDAFGIVMSHVYALNDPTVWLTDSLKFDLEAQGAKVVDGSQATNADVSISGTIQLCRVDMYFTAHGDLVVDFDVEPKKGELRHHQIHTYGSTLASLASEGEYFHALRECRQQFSILAIHEIAQALKSNP